MHCASLGEFEQGRPVLESLRNAYPASKIVLTFFSPSGYEVRKQYAGADYVLYLPMDSPVASRQFIRCIRPSLVLWVKYEYWYYYLAALKKDQVPVLLISAIFRNNQPFFKGYGGMWKKMLNSFTHLFVQTKASAELLATIGFKEVVSVSGDTRFDRVNDLLKESTALPEHIEQFCAGHAVLVAGSTWDDDEAELVHYTKAHPDIRFIVAPHETDRANVLDVQKTFAGSLLYSEMEKENNVKPASSNVLIIDRIGLLSRLYKLATVAYIGGGFNSSGIHNILEAAVYGKPVVFGPVYEKFEEARALVKKQAAFSINNALELETVFNKLFGDAAFAAEAGRAAGNYVSGHRGASRTIINYIQEKRLLIS